MITFRKLDLLYLLLFKVDKSYPFVINFNFLLQYPTSSHVFFALFETTTINSLKLQASIKYNYDNPFKNFKSTYCCNNFYNGNKKKCDICKCDLKF